MRIREMVLRSPLAFVLALTVLGGKAASACEACDAEGPVVVYGTTPYPVQLPPVGYVLDPSDARRPYYVVNHGPVYSGPGIVTYAVPTYSEGGYSYGYPYVYGYFSHRYYHKPAYPLRRPAYRGRPENAYRVGYAHPRHPAKAYRYRPAPSARVVKVRDQRTSTAPAPQARPSAPAKPASARVPPPAREGTTHTR